MSYVGGHISCVSTVCPFSPGNGRSLVIPRQKKLKKITSTLQGPRQIFVKITRIPPKTYIKKLGLALEALLLRPHRRLHYKTGNYIFCFYLMEQKLISHLFFSRRIGIPSSLSGLFTGFIRLSRRR